MADESFGVGGVGRLKDSGAVVLDGRGASVVDVDRGVHPDAGVAMLGVVPAEEIVSKRPGVLDRAEMFGKVGSVLVGLEL